MFGEAQIAPQLLIAPVSVPLLTHPDGHSPCRVNVDGSVSNTRYVTVTDPS
jgi:hypothetical protein